MLKQTGFSDAIGRPPPADFAQLLKRILQRRQAAGEIFFWVGLPASKQTYQLGDGLRIRENHVKALWDQFARGLVVLHEVEIVVGIGALIFEFGKKFEAGDLADRTLELLDRADQVEDHN